MKNTLTLCLIFIGFSCFSQPQFGSLTTDIKNSIIIQGNQLVVYENFSGTRLRSYPLPDDMNNRFPSAFLTNNKKKILIMNNNIVEVIDISTEKRTTYLFGLGDKNNFLAVKGSRICRVAEGTETNSFSFGVHDLENNTTDDSFSVKFPSASMLGLSHAKVFGALSEKHIALFFEPQGRIFIISRKEKKVIAETALEAILMEQPGDMLFGPHDNSLVLMHSSGIAYFDFTNNKVTNLENEFVTSTPAFITPDNYFIARTAIAVRNRNFKFQALPDAGKGEISTQVTEASFAKLLSNGNIMVLSYKNRDLDSVYMDFAMNNETLTLLTVNNEFYIITPDNPPVRVKDSKQKPFVYDAMNTPQDVKLSFNLKGKSYVTKLSDIFSTMKSLYFMSRGFYVYDYNEKETIFETKKKHKEYMDAVYLDFVLRDGKIYALIHVPNDISGDSFKVIDIQNGSELYNIEAR